MKIVRAIYVYYGVAATVLPIVANVCEQLWEVMLAGSGCVIVANILLKLIESE